MEENSWLVLTFPYTTHWECLDMEKQNKLLQHQSQNTILLI